MQDGLADTLGLRSNDGFDLRHQGKEIRGRTGGCHRGQNDAGQRCMDPRAMQAGPEQQPDQRVRGRTIDAQPVERAE